MEHFRHSTDDVQAEEALDYWADAVLPQLEAQLRSADHHAFSCTMSGRRRAELAIANVAISSYSGQWRENARLIGNRDSARILRVHRGQLRLADRAGNEWLVRAGGSFISGPDAVVNYDILPTRAGGVALIGDMTTIPLRQLKIFGAIIPRDLAQLLPCSQQAILLNHYVDALRSDATSDADLKRMIHHFTELTALTLGVEPANVNATPLLDAHFERAVKLIETHCHDGHLTSQAAAAALGISERTLFKAFELRHQSFHGHLIVQRLTVAARRLRLPAEISNITTIAFESGFDSISAFNRNFKVRFGMSPRDYRKQTLAAGGGKSNTGVAAG